MRWIELCNYLVMDVHNSRRVKLLVLRCGHPKLTTKSVMKRAAMVGGGGGGWSDTEERNGPKTGDNRYRNTPPDWKALFLHDYFGHGVRIRSLRSLFDMPFKHI